MTGSQVLADVRRIPGLHSVVAVAPAARARQLGASTDDVPGPGMVSATVLAGDASEACDLAGRLASFVTRSGGETRLVGPACKAAVQASSSPTGRGGDADATLAGTRIAVLVTPAGRVVASADGKAGGPPCAPDCGPLPVAVAAFLAADVRVVAVAAVQAAAPANYGARGTLQTTDALDYLDGGPREYGNCGVAAPATACYSEALPNAPGLNLPTRNLAVSDACNTAACGQDFENSLASSGSSGLTQLGLDGSNQIVGMCDTGLDLLHPYFYDNSGAQPPISQARPVPGTVSTAHRKVAYYFSFMDSADLSGHGTHCAGTIGGSSDATLPAAFAAQLDADRGMAFNARFAVVDTECAAGNASHICSCPPEFPCTCLFQVRRLFSPSLSLSLSPTPPPRSNPYAFLCSPAAYAPVTTAGS